MKISRLYDLLSDIKPHPEQGLSLFLQSQNEEAFAEIGEELKYIVLFSDFSNVLTDTGVVTEHSLFREFLYRMNRKFFPPVYRDQEFRGMLRILNERFNFTQIVLELSPELLAELISKCFPKDELSVRALPHKLHPAFKILVTRLLFQCTSRQIFSRLENAPQIREIILDLDKHAYEFLEHSDSESLEELNRALQSCDEACEHIRDNRTTEGISLDVTFRIIAIQDILARVKGLARLLVSEGEEDVCLRVARLIQTILYLESESNKVGPLFWEYLELWSYEITEHTGRKGEDYIQRDQKGSLNMLKKGVIGGAIVGALAFFKPMLSEWQLPPLMEALGFSFIYSGIFLLIYFFGGVLATKQPAMTASRLANELDKAKPSTSYLGEVSDLIRDTFRSQFLAIFGNFILALPVASLLCWVLYSFNIYSLQPETAKYLIQSLHPILSFSIFYAALTGVCLAISGIAAGGIRNWYIFNKIPNRIKDRSLFVSLLGQNRVDKALEIFDRHLEAIVGNVSLGILLGFLSTAGSVLGLPIDIRHITFASAQVGSALAHFQFDFSGFYVLVVILGVLLIGIINLSVSFAVIFLIAAKSRRLSLHQGRRVVAICLSRFFKEPSTYFWKTKT